MQVQTQEVSTEQATTTAFQVGDEVSYVAMRKEGRGYRLSARTGKIIEIDGQVATIRGGNGRCSVQPLQKLTPAGQPNALTRALMGER
ncbi:hypothetical protein [Pseudomonas sp. 2835]|uniref:hypothetical protein n=1 Tax=Pseudomonas sp. 2835 TaxID=3156451 RepID=UPI003D1AC006